MTRILVAGGAGFIGSHLCRSLLRDGHDVVCIDNLSTSTRASIDQLETLAKFTFIEADVADSASIDMAQLSPVDTIIHLASPASPVDYGRFPLRTMAANSLGTWCLLEMARDTGASLVFVSTSEVYGDPTVHPQPETYWGNVDPTGPRSCYDESKRFGEALVFSARRVYGVRANVVRLFNTYGPGMRPDDGRAIPAMIGAALEGRPVLVHGDGLQTRSFCYVSDLVAGLKHVLLDQELDGEILNIGNPTEVTVRELAEMILRLAGREGGLRFVDSRPGDPRRRQPVIDRMTHRYGWGPRVGLEEGLSKTLRAAGVGLGRDGAVDRRSYAASGW
jgi:nucleoside-diphosphate-sugar epimerase